MAQGIFHFSDFLSASIFGVLFVAISRYFIHRVATVPVRWPVRTFDAFRNHQIIGACLHRFLCRHHRRFHFRQLRQCFRFVLNQNVGVQVRRQLRVRMPHEALRNGKGNAGFRQHRAVAMPQRMEIGDKAVFIHHRDASRFEVHRQHLRAPLAPHRRKCLGSGREKEHVLLEVGNQILWDGLVRILLVLRILGADVDNPGLEIETPLRQSVDFTPPETCAKREAIQQCPLRTAHAMHNRAIPGSLQETADFFEQERTAFVSPVGGGIQFRHMLQRVYHETLFLRQPIAEGFRGGEIMIRCHQRHAAILRGQTPVLHAGRGDIGKRLPIAFPCQSRHLTGVAHNLLARKIIRLHGLPPVIEVCAQRLPGGGPLTGQNTPLAKTLANDCRAAFKELRRLGIHAYAAHAETDQPPQLALKLRRRGPVGEAGYPADYIGMVAEFDGVGFVRRDLALAIGPFSTKNTHALSFSEFLPQLLATRFKKVPGEAYSLRRRLRFPGRKLVARHFDGGGDATAVVAFGGLAAPAF